MTASHARPAWLHRRVLNVEDVLSWLVEAGVPKCMPTDQIHFTQATIRQPVDWTGVEPDADELVIPAGPKPTQIFASTIKALTFRHERIADRHALLLSRYPMIDHPVMRPHVSLYKGGRMPRTVYEGPLRLGPEMLTEFDPANVQGIKHVKVIEALSGIRSTL